MRSRGPISDRGGFTLTELLVVMAIITTLAALLFPVFRSTRAASLQNVCVQRYKSTLTAHQLYTGDYDDFVAPATYRAGPGANPTNDRKWPQLLAPYLRTFEEFRCPADTAQRPSTESLFDSDLIPSDASARFYSFAERSNIGYNAYYFSPPVVFPGNRVLVSPRNLGQVESPSNTIMFVDSIYDLDAAGRPTGGGYYVVTPPCRYIEEADGSLSDTFQVMQVPVGGSYLHLGGWSNPKRNDRNRYGGAWPWHEGRMTVGFTDGHVAPMTPTQLVAGCENQPEWQGTIINSGNYFWDLR